MIPGIRTYQQHSQDSPQARTSASQPRVWRQEASRVFVDWENAQSLSRPVFSWEGDRGGAVHPRQT